MEFEIAQLRHLYAQLIQGTVKDSAAAKRIAEGLLAPVIERLERQSQQIEALKADAERYQWLRNFHANVVHDNLPHIAAGGDYVGAWALHSEAADEAIDAARARLGEGVANAEKLNIEAAALTAQKGKF